MSGKDDNKLTLFSLVMYAIGTTLASGVFSISGDMAANGAGTAAVIVGWLIVGVGMTGLVSCYAGLNKARPDLESGIYSYAKAGFGDYLGFSTAWGYWLGAILANVSFVTLLFSAMGYFFPIFGEGNNLASIVAGSLLIWGSSLLILRGVKEAASVNTAIVIAKIIPIAVMIVAIIFFRSFKLSIFLENFMGEESGLSFMKQIMATTPTTMWCFVGIESVVVISQRARKKRDSSRATIISFISLLCIYLMISLLSMGVLSTAELAALGNPPMSGVMEAVIGKPGAILVNVAVIISLLGAIYSYTLFNADAVYSPAAQGAFPKSFTKLNKNEAPSTSLLISNLITQAFLIILLFSESTYQAFYALSSAFMLIPYLLVALYYVIVLFKKEGNTKDLSDSKMMLQRILALTGVIYAVWLLISLGFSFVLVSTMIYVPGVLVYMKAKKEQAEKPFVRRMDIVFLAIISIAAVASVVLLMTGQVNPF